MALRIHEAFNLFDCNKDGVIDFLEVKVGLERLKLYPKVELLEEDWRDITNHGQLCGDNYTLNYHQFFEVMRNQVTLYVQRVASKAFAWSKKSTKEAMSTAPHLSSSIL
jgi:Ca2+-binding EF-hand superfamily protein